MFGTEQHSARDIYDTGPMGWGTILLIVGIVFSFTPLGAMAIILGVGGFILIASNIISNKLVDIRLVLQGKDLPTTRSSIEKKE